MEQKRKEESLLEKKSIKDLEAVQVMLNGDYNDWRWYQIKRKYLRRIPFIGMLFAFKVHEEQKYNWDVIRRLYILALVALWFILLAIKVYIGR